jgi:galactokinase
MDRHGVTGWAGYVAGVVWVLRDAGLPVPGADLAIRSDVPLGAGLSSSAALECAVLTALVDLGGLDLPVGDRPAQAQFDLSSAGLATLVIDTKAPHRHVSGEYAARRASCEAAAAALGVPALRDVTDLPAALAKLDDAVLRRRVRHVVTEDQRVLSVVDLLRAGRPRDIGPLLTESHASMRDEFEITVPEVDTAVEAALAAGAYGARMTGGGFGGCVLALVDADATGRVSDAVATAFAARGFAAPAPFVATASAGATRL